MELICPANKATSRTSDPDADISTQERAIDQALYWLYGLSEAEQAELELER